LKSKTLFPDEKDKLVAKIIYDPINKTVKVERTKEFNLRNYQNNKFLSYSSSPKYI